MQCPTLQQTQCQHNNICKLIITITTIISNNNNNNNNDDDNGNKDDDDDDNKHIAFQLMMSQVCEGEVLFLHSSLVS